MLLVGDLRKFIEGSVDERQIDVVLTSGDGSVSEGVETDFGQELGINLELRVLIPEGQTLVPTPKSPSA